MSSPENVSERTGLVSGINRPRYAFDTGLASERRRRLRQFQCCICVILTCLLVMTVVVTVAYSIQDEVSNQNATNNTDFLNTLVLPMEAPKINLLYTSDIEWENAYAEAANDLVEADALQAVAPELEYDTPSFRHQKIISGTEKALMLSRTGQLNESTGWHLRKNNSTLSKAVLCPTSSSSLKMCQTTSSCEFHVYRTYDGTCNNLLNPNSYGVAYTPFRRSLSPDYADGVSAPRRSRDGGSLPSARTVSTTVHRPFSRDDRKFTVMLAVWGQFLDHDISATAPTRGFNGSTISCCSSSDIIHPQCFPVLLDSGDPYYQQYNLTCMEFVRSAASPTCCLGPREQMNQVSSFIDGSAVYGTDDQLVGDLRTMRDGLLKMLVIKNRMLLPISEDPTDGCNREKERQKGRYCFMTGDGRANENLHLTSMHLIWARHHNNLAKKLAAVNPHWDDETLYQEARKIVGAQMQHITYNEFLPILLGPKAMDKYDLKPKTDGYYHGYNSSLDPSIANNFATAAFRFAHSLIPGLMKVFAKDTSSPEYRQMRYLLLDPFKLYDEGELDKSLESAMQTSIQANDVYFTNELKEHLFERDTGKYSTNKMCGLDLVSLNIQRGRDHGLPGYNIWREHCGLKKTSRFEDFTDIHRESLASIRSIYRHVDDVDLYTGALSELPLEGSILGPTLTCLLLDQFIRLKRGDRYWYESDSSPGKFSKEQLRQVRKTSLAAIICDNSDGVDLVQPRVMESLHDNNRNVPCRDIPRIDIGAWKTERAASVPVLDTMTAVRVIQAN